jgi:hypothetical protein
MEQVLMQTTKSTSCTLLKKLDAFAPTRPFVRLWAALKFGAAFFFAKEVRFGAVAYNPAANLLTLKGPAPFVVFAEATPWVFSSADVALVSNYSVARPDGVPYSVHFNPHGVTPEGLPAVDPAQPAAKAHSLDSPEGMLPQPEPRAKRYPPPTQPMGL